MAKSLTYPRREPDRPADLALVSDQRLGPPVVNTRYGLRDFLTLLFKEKRLLLTTFLVTLILAVLASFVPSTKYTATSRLLVLLSREYTFRPQVGPEGGPTLALENTQIIRSEIEILGNPELKRSVLNTLGIENVYPKLAAKESDGPAEQRERLNAAVKAFTTNLKIEPVRESNVIHLAFAHPDPRIAADALNLLVQNYLESRRQVYGQRGSEFLIAQRDDFARRLAEADKALEAFKLQNDITVLDEQKLLLLRNKAELETDRRTAASRLREVTAQLDNLNRSMAGIPKTVPLYSETTSTAAVESAKARLLELQLRRNELMAKYAPTSRFVTEVNEQIALVQRFLMEEDARRPATRRTGPNPVYEQLATEAIRLRAEAESLQARQASLDEQLAAMDQRITKLEELDREYKDLTLNRQILEQQYQAYASKAEEARILEDLDRRDAANIRIIEQAVPPTEGRNLQPMIILLGIFVGLLTALAAALFREFTRTTLVTPEAAERALGLPVLVAIPTKVGAAPEPSGEGARPDRRRFALPVRRRRTQRGLGGSF